MQQIGPFREHKINNSNTSLWDCPVTQEMFVGAAQWPYLSSTPQYIKLWDVVLCSGIATWHVRTVSLSSRSPLGLHGHRCIVRNKTSWFTTPNIWREASPLKQPNLESSSWSCCRGGHSAGDWRGRFRDKGHVPESLRATGKAVLGTHLPSHSSDGNNYGKD